MEGGFDVTNAPRFPFFYDSKISPLAIFPLWIMYLRHNVTEDYRFMRSMKEGYFVMLAWPWNMLGSVKRWCVLFSGVRLPFPSEINHSAPLNKPAYHHSFILNASMWSTTRNAVRYIITLWCQSITPSPLSRHREPLHPYDAKHQAFITLRCLKRHPPLSSYQPKEKAPLGGL